MVDFGGWDMPVQYPAGTIEEHLRTRTHAGLFDVSHMGEIDVRGTDAVAFVNRITSNDVRKLVDGQAQYTALTTPQGTVIDDLLVYRLAADHLLLVVNASTTDKDWEWITSNHSGESVELNNVSSDYCQLALQGPDAQSILQKLTQVNWGLVLLITVVASVGFAALYSAAGGSLEPWAGRQMVRFGVGIILMLTVALVDIRIWYRFAYVLYGIGFVLLVAAREHRRSRCPAPRRFLRG